MTHRHSAMSIAQVLHTQVESNPSGTAIADTRHGRTLTFAELEQSSLQVARQLQQAGLRSGQAVLILQPMSARLYEVMLGVFQIGAIAMFVDPASGLPHLERCCQLYPPQAFVATGKAHLLRLRSAALRRIPLQFYSDGWVPTARRLQSPPETGSGWEWEAIAPDAPALLTFTSGSTGQPKAALRTHGFLLAQHQALANSLHLRAGQVDLATLPIFVLANLASGVTSLIPDADLRYPGRVNAARVLRQIQQEQPSRTAASPAFLERLVEFAQPRGMALNLQQIYSGGAPVFPRLLRQLQAIAAQSAGTSPQVTAVYGSTEAEPIAHVAYREIGPEDFDRMGSGGGLLAGPPVPEIGLKILADHWGKPLGSLSPTEFAAQCLPVGAIGEIVVSGNHVLPGYLQGQGDAETKFRVEGIPWHRTGDAGYLDERGRLWLMGRCSARIEDAQGVIYPFAVEAAVSEFPGVRRSALVGLQGRRLLLVETEPGWQRGRESELMLQRWREAIAWAKIDEIQRWANIPVDKRHNAKVDYPSLYQRLNSSYRRRR